MRVKEIVEKWRTINKGNRSLFESVIAKEVMDALRDWTKNADKKYVIIGGIALSYYSIPRYTSDVDALYVMQSDIPDNVEAFKHHRKGAFEHKKTGVEVEVISPETINLDPELAKQVEETAVTVEDGIKIASKSGLVALKLQARRTGSKGKQDEADILNLSELGGIDLSGFKLSPDDIKRYDDLLNDK